MTEAGLFAFLNALWLPAAATDEYLMQAIIKPTYKENPFFLFALKVEHGVITPSKH